MFMKLAAYHIDQVDPNSTYMRFPSRIVKLAVDLFPNPRFPSRLIRGMCQIFNQGARGDFRGWVPKLYLPWLRKPSSWKLLLFSWNWL